MQWAKKEQLQKGIWAASAGNMAQGVAWCARQLGMKCTVVVPESALETKIPAIQRLGAPVVSAPFEDWLHILRSRSYEGMGGLFIHAFSNPAVMAGHGTIGLEIVEDLPRCGVMVLEDRKSDWAVRLS